VYWNFDYLRMYWRAFNDARPPPRAAWGVAGTWGVDSIRAVTTLAQACPFPGRRTIERIVSL
jgi:hypothetical protein